MGRLYGKLKDKFLNENVVYYEDYDGNIRRLNSETPDCIKDDCTHIEIGRIANAIILQLRVSIELENINYCKNRQRFLTNFYNEYYEYFDFLEIELDNFLNVEWETEIDDRFGDNFRRCIKFVYGIDICNSIYIEKLGAEHESSLRAGNYEYTEQLLVDYLRKKQATGEYYENGVYQPISTNSAYISAIGQNESPRVRK